MGKYFREHADGYSHELVYKLNNCTLYNHKLIGQENVYEANIEMNLIVQMQKSTIHYVYKLNFHVFSPIQL